MIKTTARSQRLINKSFILTLLKNLQNASLFASEYVNINEGEKETTFQSRKLLV